MTGNRHRRHSKVLGPMPSGLLILGISLITSHALAQPTETTEPMPLKTSVGSQAKDILEAADDSGTDASPVRRIQRNRGSGNPSGPGRRDPRPGAGSSLDGSGNDQSFPEENASHTALARLTVSAYGDGVASPAGNDRPSARQVSNLVNAQSEALPNSLGLTSFVWQWGQFLDHDIDLTDGIRPPEPFNIPVPSGDPWFDPDGTGNQRIALNRSLYDLSTGLNAANPRQQVNEITGWIDASSVYGSDLERAAALRLLDGSGRLATSDGDLLPFNVDGLENAGGLSAELFVAGDVRANEQIGLAAMHTLFVREHNRQALRLADQDPSLSGDELYLQARNIVIGIVQVITYREFLPALLGPGALDRYSGYDADVDARISNTFSTAAYRMGHTLLPPELLRFDDQGSELSFGHLSLADAFFSPARIIEEGGIEPILRGLAVQVCQDFDVYIVDEVRNFLFGLPGSGGFDLASLNIQRGRDHGLPDYNTLRLAMGLTPALTMEDISSDPEVVERLSRAYESPDHIDPWVGGLAEDALEGALVGELVGAVLADQFERLRDGDRFWYTRTLSAAQRQQVQRTRLADVIRRNTTIGAELGDRDVFRTDN
ncbi:MAG: peroxidase family protein [Lysobacterales bacterium]